MPLRKPKTGESQSEWMSYCMGELAESDTDRPQEQRVAICLNAWRDRNKAAERWSCGASRDLPIAETERSWDGPAAAARMLDKANIGEEEGANPSQARRGFLIYDAANGDLRGSYSCPFADLVDGQLKAIPSGLRAAASRLPQVTDVSQEVKDRARGVLDAYFARMEDNDEKSMSEKQQLPRPRPDEIETHFLERCHAHLIGMGKGDGEANRLCALAWTNGNGRSVEQQLRHKVHAEAVQGKEFILSDSTPDRIGDVISVEGWDLTAFRKNPIALWQHLANFPIGRWSNLRAEDNALRGHLELAPEGTSERIDEIRKLVEAGILRAVSVGFRPIESRPRMVGEKFLGQHFIKQELVETSLVSVPANPNALAVAKSLKISPETIDLVFGEHAKGSAVRREGAVGEHAVTSKDRRATMEPLTKRIEASQDRITNLRNKLEEHLGGIDDTNVSDSQLEVTNELHSRIAQEQKTLTSLQDSEKLLTKTLSQENGDGHGANGGTHRAVIPATARGRPTIPTMPQKKEDMLDLIVRAGVAAAFAHTRRISVEQARVTIANVFPHYNEDNTKAFCDYIQRAESTPATTFVPAWAGVLSQMIHAAYMELLMPESVFPRLAALGLSLSFGRAGSISIPTRETTPSIAGSFVGEGQPIPVRQAAFRAVVLVPLKMAVITTWTREIGEASIPAIEGLLRNAIQEDTAIAIDSVLLDQNPATATRPAGLLNGVTALTATTGGGFNALVGDLKQLVGTILTATHGHVRKITLLMNPSETLSLALTALPGVSTFPFMDQVANNRLLDYNIIKSGTVPAGRVIAVDASDFVVVGGESPRFEVSDQASLHMDDSDPQPITGGTPSPAIPVRSLWQTDSLGLRLILPLNWVMRRPGLVAWVDGVTW